MIEVLSVAGGIHGMRAFHVVDLQLGFVQFARFIANLNQLIKSGGF